MDITNWSMVPDTRAVNLVQFNLVDNPVSTQLNRIISGVVRLNASLKHAYRVERRAKHLYAMSDKDLDRRGLSREDIPAYLAKSFPL